MFTLVSVYVLFERELFQNVNCVAIALENRSLNVFGESLCVLTDDSVP